ncbi:hypothetical protein LJR235_004586 [Pararhizobium sp. LjRoot235]|uniref:hypothetical protein n=1 Tax=Pararhizobium sp. LjRoot235 TaxID=3342291 RepID=UPI003ECFBA45
MARAMLKPEVENKGGRGKLSQDRDSLEKSERNALAQARYLLRHDEHARENRPLTTGGSHS